MTWTVQWLARKSKLLYSFVRPTRNLCLSSNYWHASAPHKSAVCSCLWAAVAEHSILFLQKLPESETKSFTVRQNIRLQQNEDPCITADILFNAKVMFCIAINHLLLLLFAMLYLAFPCCMWSGLNIVISYLLLFHLVLLALEIKLNNLHWKYYK